jgi:predicted site-specific integrase-resolvase
VSSKTIKKWESEGKLRTVRTQGNQRRIPESEILRLLNIEQEKPKKVIAYARCSTQKQRDNLERQIERLRQYCETNKHDYEVYSEIASGLNDNRRQLLKIINRVSQGDISEVVIEYKDRLTRFGFKFFVEFFNIYGTKITVIEDTTAKELEEELVSDLISLVTSHSARLYGRRGGRKTIIEQEQVSKELDANENNNQGTVD